MSSTRVVTGVDERGRPKSEWRSTPADAEPRYGHMEPAHTASIERRQATPEELAAARAREEEPSHLVAPTIGSPGVIVQRAPGLRPVDPAEESPVSEPPTNIPEIIPDGPGAPSLDALAEAAAAARDAHHEKEAADAAWEIAREALARAYGAVEGIVEPLPPQPDDDGHYILTVPLLGTTGQAAIAPEPVEAAQPPKSTRVGPPGTHAQRAAGISKRAELVRNALERHGGDTKAAGRELGMRGNVVARIAKSAERRDQVAPA